MRPSAASEASEERLRYAADAVERLKAWAYAIAASIARRCGRLRDLDALRSAALEGLWRAALIFDPDRGTSLRTIAAVRVNGSCVDWIRADEVIKTRTRKRLSALGEFVPREGQLHDVMDSDRLGAPSHDIDRRSPDPLEAIERAESADAVLSLFREGREREVFRLYFVLGIGMKTVGEIVGVTESRVCQIISAATKRVRASLRYAGTTRTVRGVASATRTGESIEHA